MPDLHVLFDLVMLRHQRSFAISLTGLKKSKGYFGRSTHPQHAFLQQIHIIPQILNCIACVTGFTSNRQGVGEVLLWTSAPPQVVFLHFPVGVKKS